MDKGKIFTIILWVALLINYLMSFSVWINYSALLLLTIHAIEYVVFFKRIKNSNSGLLNGLFQTMVFGVLYIGGLKK